MSNLAKEVSGRVLITHTDLDGLGCAIVYNKCFPGVVNNFVNYDKVNSVVNQTMSKFPNTPIMISDMSVSSETLAEEMDKRGKVELIDHHHTAEWLSKYEWALVNTTKSASMIMYEVMSTRFNIEDLLPLVTLIDNYDTWGGGPGPNSSAKRLNRLLGIYGIPRFYDRFYNKPSPKLNKTEELLLEIEEEKIDEFVKDVIKSASLAKDTNGNDYALISVDRYISEACHEVLKEFKDIEFVMAIDFVKNKVSLRGRGKINLGEMAKQMGGGGHKQAAGFQIKHGSQIRMLMACEGRCPVTERLEAIIKDVSQKGL